MTATIAATAFAALTALILIRSRSRRLLIRPRPRRLPTRSGSATSHSRSATSPSQRPTSLAPSAATVSQRAATLSQRAATPSGRAATPDRLVGPPLPRATTHDRLASSPLRRAATRDRWADSPAPVGAAIRASAAFRMGIGASAGAVSAGIISAGAVGAGVGGAGGGGAVWVGADALSLVGADRRLARALGGRGPGRRVLVGLLVIGPLVLAVAATVVGGQAAVLLLAATVVAGAVSGMRRRSRRRAEAAARRGRVIEACGVLASDLRAGRVPLDALDGAATVCPELAAAVSAARLGGDVPDVLDEVAALPGASGLRALGAAWRVAEQSGAAFAGVAERVADALRGDELVRRQVSAGLAGARATARLLAGLPVLGLGLGYAVGADPLRFLGGTPIGWLCLILGILLAATGLAWVERLADSCENPDGGAA